MAANLRTPRKKARTATAVPSLIFHSHIRASGSSAGLTLRCPTWSLRRQQAAIHSREEEQLMKALSNAPKILLAAALLATMLGACKRNDTTPATTGDTTATTPAPTSGTSGATGTPADTTGTTGTTSGTSGTTGATGTSDTGTTGSTGSTTGPTSGTGTTGTTDDRGTKDKDKDPSRR
jgi:hypothetical protein